LAHKTITGAFLDEIAYDIQETSTTIWRGGEIPRRYAPCPGKGVLTAV